MKYVKRFLEGVLLLSVIWFASFGCTQKTKGLWADKHYTVEYDEKIYAFYTNIEKNYLAIVGEKFHYVFDEQTEAFLALLGNKDFLNLQQENLQIHARVEGSEMYTDIIVSFDESRLNAQQRAWLLSHNYTTYTYSYAIKGKRYIADAKVNAAIAQKLKRAIPLKIIEKKKEKGNSMLYKIAMTPLTVASDAAGTVLVAVGAAIVLPVGLIASAIHK